MAAFLTAIRAFMKAYTINWFTKKIRKLAEKYEVTKQK